MFIFKFVLVHKETIRLQIHKDLGNFWLAAYRLFFVSIFFLNAYSWFMSNACQEILTLMFLASVDIFVCFSCQEMEERETIITSQSG